MRQTIVTLSADVRPRSLDVLRICIADLKKAVEHPRIPGGSDPYATLATAIPSLHFASIMVFEDDHYDPLLTVELNIDGDIGPFLPQLAASGLEPYLRTMVRCCKRPSGPAAALYDLATAAGSTVPLAPFLETRIVKPAVFHQGNRGLDRARIAREAELFQAAQAALDAPALYQATDAVALHGGLRAALLPAHAWLDQPAPTRWTRAERAMDGLRLFGFVSGVLFCLSIPGMILTRLMPSWPIAPWLIVAICLAAAGAIVWAIPEREGTGARAEPVPPPAPGLPYVPPMTPETKLLILGVAILAAGAYLTALAALSTLLLGAFYLDSLGSLFIASFGAALTGLFTIELPLAIVVYWIRWLELRDSTQEDPHDDLAKLRRILDAEDQIAQNHMGSVVLIKPGLLRAIVIRAGLWGLGLALRALLTTGYLGSMRTIHFAHWAILNNGGRLVFFSNFDSSWESYLDDFIEKAHAGLTLAWTNGVGFAPTEFLIGKGAISGRLFKAWARHSMAEGLFWFSAYKDLSVNQIERQYRIAAGLGRPSLSPAEAERWACDL